MSEPFLAEVKIVGFDFAPRGFAQCDGQLLPINQHQALFSLLGTIYGGDGRQTFALPDLRGRVPIHFGGGFTQGQRGGEETHTLQLSEIPSHTHGLNGTSATANTADPSGARLAPAAGGRRPLVPYGEPANLTPLSSSAVANTGASQGHDNMQPYLALNFVIALQGLFPSRN